MREVAHAFGIGCDADKAAIGVVAVPCADTLADDGRAAALAIVDHLGAGVGLLIIVGDGNRVKLSNAVFAVEDAARIFPRHCAARFDLRPAHLAVPALTQSALGHEVIYATFAFGVARVPVLHGRIFDFGIVQRNEFDNSGVQLVFVAHWRGAAFEIGHITALVGDNQRTFKLAGILGIDAEIGGELHRASHAFRDINKCPVGEDRAVQRCKIIVMHRHNLAEPFLHQLRIFLNRLRYAAENHASTFKFCAKGGGDRNTVEHGVHSHAARALDASQHFLLCNRDAQLLINTQNFGVYLVQRAKLWLGLRLGVIISVLIIDWRHVELCPIRRRHRFPRCKRLQPPFEHPFRLIFLGGNEANGIFGQPLGREVGFNVR